MRFPVPHHRHRGGGFQDRRRPGTSGSRHRPHRPGYGEAVYMKQKVSPARIAESLTEFWSPRIIADVDDAYVKVAKVQGTLAWHSHENEDELFLVLKGC